MKYLSNNDFRQREINILISNLFILSVFILFKDSLINLLNLLPHFCLIDKLFGIECPVCGTTRALCELAKGNINNAYHLNATSALVAFYFVLQIPLRSFSLLKENSQKNINSFSKYLGNILLILILVNWIIKFF